jgi:hypothetical protein
MTMPSWFSSAGSTAILAKANANPYLVLAAWRPRAGRNTASMARLSRGTSTTDSSKTLAFWSRLATSWCSK